MTAIPDGGKVIFFKKIPAMAVGVYFCKKIETFLIF
jgi:hypothetical protein